jgi:hypothetical protein
MTIKCPIRRASSHLRRVERPRSDEAANDSGPERRHYTRDEYYRMADIGLFDRQRVELVHGEVLRVSPVKSPHATSVSLSNEVFSRLLARSFSVRVQLPLDLTDRRVEIRRRPSGFEYGLISIHRSSEFLRPLCAPHARIRVSSLLP